MSMATSNILLLSNAKTWRH